MQTTLQVAGVDCAEEVSLIHRALKPLGGVREVRVNIMSGKAIIAHNETITPDVLIKAIGRLKALAVDKTGTITEGRPRVTGIVPIGVTVDVEVFLRGRVDKRVTRLELATSSLARKCSTN